MNNEKHYRTLKLSSNRCKITIVRLLSQRISLAWLVIQLLHILQVARRIARQLAQMKMEQFHKNRRNMKRNWYEHWKIKSEMECKLSITLLVRMVEDACKEVIFRNECYEYAKLKISFVFGMIVNIKNDIQPVSPFDVHKRQHSMCVSYLNGL